MNRYSNWMDRPVTWRGYLKLAGVATVIGTVISAVWYTMLMEPTWWKVTKDFVKRVFNR